MTGWDRWKEHERQVVSERRTEPIWRLISVRSGVRALPDLPRLTESYGFRPIASRHSAGTHMSAMMQKSRPGGTPV